MEQLTIEDALAGPPAQRLSDTSVAAAQSIQPHRARALDKVLAAIATWGPITDEELSIRLGMNPSTVRPRRVELQRAGKIAQHPLTRPTLSGRRAAAWVEAR